MRLQIIHHATCVMQLRKVVLIHAHSTVYFELQPSGSCCSASDTRRLSPASPFPESHIIFNYSATGKTNLPNQTLSASGIANGLLNGSVCGNDIGVMSAPYRDIGEQSVVVQFGLPPKNTLPDNAATFNRRLAVTWPAACKRAAVSCCPGPANAKVAKEVLLKRKASDICVAINVLKPLTAEVNA